MLLNNEWVNNEIRKKSKYTLKQMKMREKSPKSVGQSKSNSKREIHSITSLTQESRKNLK